MLPPVFSHWLPGWNVSKGFSRSAGNRHLLALMICRSGIQVYRDEVIHFPGTDDRRRVTRAVLPTPFHVARPLLTKRRIDARSYIPRPAAWPKGVGIAHGQDWFGLPHAFSCESSIGDFQKRISPTLGRARAERTTVLSDCRRLHPDMDTWYPNPRLDACTTGCGAKRTAVCGVPNDTGRQSIVAGFRVER